MVMCSGSRGTSVMLVLIIIFSERMCLSQTKQLNHVHITCYPRNKLSLVCRRRKNNLEKGLWES